METKDFRFLRMTDSMRSFLLEIATQSIVAQYLLGHRKFTDYGDFLAIRRKDNTPMISFCPKGKQQEFNEQGDYIRKNRQEGTPARVAQKLIGEGVFTNSEYELFNNLFVGGTNMGVEFHVGGDADDFKFAYLDDNYIPTHTGSLWNSCMRYEKCQDYVGMYEEFEAKILYATIGGKVAARAILWTLDDGDLLLDRIYGYNDSIKYAMLQYAKKNLGIAWYKEKDSYDTPTEFIHVIGEEERNVRRSFTIHVGSVVKEDTEVPYMDTFKYFADGYLYNDEDEDMGDERYKMCDTNGESETQYRCAKCHHWQDEDETVWINNDQYCRDCAVWDEWSEDYIREEDSVSAVDCRGRIITTHIDNVVALGNGDYALENAVVCDDYDGDYILENESVRYTTIIGGYEQELVTHESNVADRRHFACIDDQYYEIKTCNGNLIEEIDGEWYLVGSYEWKEVKANQETEVKQDNDEEAA